MENEIVDGKQNAVFVIKKVGVDENGVIDSFDVNLTITLDVDDTYTKEDLVEDVESMEEDGISVKLVTEDGTEVILVNDGDKKYFRTKGDKSTTNDLLDLPRSEKN